MIGKFLHWNIDFVDLEIGSHPARMRFILKFKTEHSYDRRHDEHSLTQEQRDNISFDIMSRLTEESNLLINVIAFDKIWSYDLHNEVSVDPLEDSHIPKNEENASKQIKTESNLVVFF